MAPDKGNKKVSETRRGPELTLVFDEEKTLSADTYILSAASPVFRFALEECRNDRSIKLGADDYRGWEIVLASLHSLGASLASGYDAAVVDYADLVKAAAVAKKYGIESVHRLVDVRVTNLIREAGERVGRNPEEGGRFASHYAEGKDLLSVLEEVVTLHLRGATEACCREIRTALCPSGAPLFYRWRTHRVAQERLLTLLASCCFQDTAFCGCILAKELLSLLIVCVTLTAGRGMKYGLQHLSQLDIKLMLQARGESVDGEPAELLERLERVFDARTSFTWQLRQLPRRGPTPYRSGGSLVFHADRLYLYGGFDENFHLHNDFWGGRIIGDQVFWQESNAGSINSGPQLRDHYSFVWKGAVWLYGGVRIGLQRNVSEHMYYFDIDNTRWKSLRTQPVNGEWTRPENPSVPSNTVAVFHPTEERLYAFGGQVQYELGHLGLQGAYLDMNSGFWHGVPYPKGVVDIKAVCVWQEKVHAIDAAARVYTLKGMDDGSLIWTKSQEHQPHNCGMIESIKLSALLGSVWLIFWSSTPRGTASLQINMNDFSVQSANIDPISSRRESVDVLSYSVVHNSVVVTGLLGSYFSAHHGLSESATFILETCPGNVPEPISGTLQCIQAVNQIRQDATCADCIIRVQGDVEFRAHKFILAAQSSYFSRMFESGMVESIDNVVVLDDLEASVMEIVMDFVYGRVVHVAADQAVAVFRASDRLHLPDLTRLVVGILKDGIQCETIADVLHIAGNYMNEELWNACVEFTKSNMHNLRQIIGSPYYLHFMKTNAELAQRFQLDILQS